MDKKTPKPAQGSSTITSKRSYQKPRLRRFGQLAELTQLNANSVLMINDGMNNKSF
jgi:hypothetical protein